VLTVLPPLPTLWMVLVYPGFGVATKEAYARVKLPFADTRAFDQTRIQENLFNRFESLVFPDHPKLPIVKKDLLAAGAPASLMSGSGSSVFGLASSEGHGRQILEKIRPHYPQSWLIHTL